jgi:hypothetical protein
VHDPLIIVATVLGLIIAVANAAIRKFRWQQEPELSAFFEVLLSAILFTAAVRTAKLAWSLPTEQVTDEEKVYFCLGSIALIWVSATTIIRKFNKP